MSALIGEAAVKRILIVEDNEMNRDVLSRRLRRQGYEVLIAAAGLEGLRLAARRHGRI